MLYLLFRSSYLAKEWIEIQTSQRSVSQIHLIDGSEILELLNVAYVSVHVAYVSGHVAYASGHVAFVSGALS